MLCDFLFIYFYIFLLCRLGLLFLFSQGSEGGTGAAPPEFSNSVGTPLVEGLVLVDDLLTGAGLRDSVKVICSGKVAKTFSRRATVQQYTSVNRLFRGPRFNVAVGMLVGLTPRWVGILQGRQVGGGGGAGVNLWGCGL